MNGNWLVLIHATGSAVWSAIRCKTQAAANDIEAAVLAVDATADVSVIHDKDSTP